MNMDVTMRRRLALVTFLMMLHHASGSIGDLQIPLLDAQNSVLQGRLSASKELVFEVSASADGKTTANILLTLSTTNKNGDADIFCLPTRVAKESGDKPNHRFSVWKSALSQGNDFIFVSRYHSLYPVVLDEERSARIMCTVAGFAMAGTDFEVHLEIDYSERLLDRSERAALETILQTCCVKNALGARTCLHKHKAPAGNSEASFCHYQGNICDSNGHLLVLNLKKDNLACDFPIKSIKQFKHLQVLHMPVNHLQGDVDEILQELHMNLETLVVINLYQNDLKGSLEGRNGSHPAVCNITHGKGKLKVLNLELNFIEGELPACIFDSTSSLREIVLGGSTLVGKVPEVSLQSEIQIIRLDNTGLNGTIPDSLGKLGSLAVLDLSDNFLTGTLPSNIGGPPLLRTLRLEGNSLEGVIPDSVALSRSLGVVRLEINNFTGLPEAYYTNEGAVSPNLLVFDASRNFIEGTFPIGLARAPNLTLLNLAENQLTGALPDEEGLYRGLVALILASNSFEGAVPSSLATSKIFFLEEGTSRLDPLLDLSYNNFSGVPPSFLWEISSEVVLPDVKLEGNGFAPPCDNSSENPQILPTGLKCTDDEFPVLDEISPGAEG